MAGPGRFIPACAGNAASALSPSWPASVHPRIRGERGNACGFPSVSGGSSPHTRGTPAADDPMTALVRFIPAYAGNARSAIPRHGAVCGSSPHTRGTLGGKLDALRHVRFIPAYAGNALALHAGTSSPAVHPRIRGERNDPENSLKIKDGSSPHTRGTPYSIRVMPRVHRFIPAYAGNAHARERIAVSYTVHPRIRGERKLKSKDKEGTDGSSPHTRGTRRPKTPTVYRQRFIPAYAGNARGMRNQIAHGYGSSPHTRGTHRWNDAMMGRYRFIPAYAGNALSSGKKRSVLTVHPRIRGERTFLKFCRMADGGSSPHTRGTRREPERMEPVGRFIPAYAGNARVRTEPASSSPVHPRIRGERPSVLSAGPSPYGSSPHTRGTR